MPSARSTSMTRPIEAFRASLTGASMKRSSASSAALLSGAIVGRARVNAAAKGVRRSFTDPNEAKSRAEAKRRGPTRDSSGWGLGDILEVD